MNYRALTLLGIATSIVVDYQKLEAYHDNTDKCEWFIRQIENVVYLNKPMEPFPK